MRVLGCPPLSDLLLDRLETEEIHSILFSLHHFQPEEISPHYLSPLHREQLAHWWLPQVQSVVELIFIYIYDSAVLGGRISQNSALSFPVPAPMSRVPSSDNYNTRSKVSFNGNTFEVALNLEDFKPEVWLVVLVTNFLLTFPLCFVYPKFQATFVSFLIDKVTTHLSLYEGFCLLRTIDSWQAHVKFKSELYYCLPEYHPHYPL